MVCLPTPLVLQSKTIPFDTTELFLPANTLNIGVYEIMFRVFITVTPPSHPPTHVNVSTAMSTFIRLSPSTIVVQPLPSTPSLVTHTHTEPFTFNPGLFSIDPDATMFDASVRGWPS
jgi:hypothetical protein